MDQETINEILENLAMLEEDNSLPKNIRLKVKEAMCILGDDGKHIGLRVDSSLEHLGDLAEDPNMPSHSRMQIWSLVSQLESR